MTTKQYKRDLDGMEARRRKGMRMLALGVEQAEVARLLQVSRQTASTWARRLAEDPQAWRRRTLGRPSGLSEIQIRSLVKVLSAGPMKHGYPNDRWTLVLVMQLIDRRFGVSYSIVNVRRLLNSMGIRWQLLGPLRKRR